MAFTEPELHEMQVCIYDSLREAISAGNKGKALSLLKDIDRNRVQYRDMLFTWIDALLTFVASEMGEDAVFKSMEFLYQRVGKPRVMGHSERSKYNEMTAEDRLRRRAYLWTAVHGGPIDEITEDDQKFTIKLHCPSGGSVRQKPLHGKTKAAHPWSYGKTGFAYYCTHCPATFEIMSIKEFGYPAWVNMPKPGGKCVQYLFKNLEETPAKFYRRVGLKRPARVARKRD